ncbi:hypothetical protein PPL_09777 [Heterostelium album PN500]|uniref:Uncharacterized protein n=1 Tax=Heterostelium pallidum (strain ATCC 26659 / Pp 5 / PN500) TaxID=670386 RepID=D3BP15_HETP5|nr:hypothetical protein PPL_09777 [Heterostelium album PN500]EFA77025.1 hypothetical protein PPL_09777 [Heterostelium album PN500]|eukprot:XP_020429155.1 hypothetical protein PPL_09777 [Heterostelium album PN500]
MYTSKGSFQFQAPAPDQMALTQERLRNAQWRQPLGNTKYWNNNSIQQWIDKSYEESEVYIKKQKEDEIEELKKNQEKSSSSSNQENDGGGGDPTTSTTTTTTPVAAAATTNANDITTTTTTTTNNNNNNTDDMNIDITKLNTNNNNNNNNNNENNNNETTDLTQADKDKVNFNLMRQKYRSFKKPGGEEFSTNLHQVHIER